MTGTNWGAYWYNSLTLWLYDAVVLRFNMAHVWRCSLDMVLLPLFLNAFLPSEHHLDIGVATGWFPSVALENKISSTDTRMQQQITLMDLNVRSLQTAKRRIIHQHQQNNPGDAASTVAIHLIQADALAGGVPPALRNTKFDSISLFNLLHCLPGPQERKNSVFLLAAQILARDGVVVGCTILGWQHHARHVRNPLAWVVMALMNFLGGFGNWQDDAETFERGLGNEFDEVTTWVVGSMLLFRARRPKRYT